MVHDTGRPVRGWSALLKWAKIEDENLSILVADLLHFWLVSLCHDPLPWIPISKPQWFVLMSYFVTQEWEEVYLSSNNNMSYLLFD